LTEPRTGPRIAVLGAGLIGCYLGGRLLAGGFDVTLIGRAGLAAELAKTGLKTSDISGKEKYVPADRVRVVTDPAALADANVVLVTVKNGDTAEAGAQIGAAKGSALVVSFQNGVRNTDILAAQLPGRCILSGMVPFNVVKPAPGHFHQATTGDLVVETRAGAEVPLVRCFEFSGLSIRAAADIRSVLWGKLLLNLNNSVNALSGMPLAKELARRGYRAVLAESIREALRVLQCAGLTPAGASRVPPRLLPFVLSLPDWFFRMAARGMLSVDPTARSSMWEDLERRRPTEIDYLNGEIVALAERCGKGAPVNRAITRLVKQAEAAGNGSPRMTAEDLERAVRGSW